MENMVNPDPAFWRQQHVLVTGHTGFKGGWLALWLHRLGARLHGYALEPPSRPSLFQTAGLGALFASDTRADLADRTALQSTLDAAQPTVVFHLAAQPLVRAGYADPVGTWASNVMGTAHVLESIRATPSVRAVVVVTTDKVYDNREWLWPYRENDALGGHDPYSASKAATELLVASYRASYWPADQVGVAGLATARAGNVLGGGDWGAERLLPDCMRAFADGRGVSLRYPQAVRPWQHVLEPLAGYLLLAERLAAADPHAQQYAKAWNFGPHGDNAAVGAVAELAARYWGKGAHVTASRSSGNPPEANLLHLDSTAARSQIGWRPRWCLQTAVEKTVAWYQAMSRQEDMLAVSLEQLETYETWAEPS